MRLTLNQESLGSNPSRSAKQIGDMMRLLFTVILLTLTSVSCAASTTFMEQSLEQQYNVQRENITRACSAEANQLMPITRNRDAGVPLNAYIGWMLDSFVKNKNESQITTPYVLFSITLVTIVYHSSLTQEEIFNSQFRNCEKISLDNLDTFYKHIREIK